MNSSVKKLTEAAILTSVFIVITMFALTTGLGYGIYLDFGVPIMFTLIYFRCELKYTLLSGVSSILIILLVLGNFGTAILASQSFLIGVMCGYLLSLSTHMFDDLFWGAIAGVIFMVLVDIYARNLIGYSFMEEFKGYANIIPMKDYANLVYYLCIAIFPFGMVMSIYFISMMVGKKLRLLKDNEKRKYFMMRSIRNIGSFMCMSKESYYIALGYIAVFNLLSIVHISISNIYLDTIMICIEYLCLYFVIRDSYMMIGNYIGIKYRNRYFNYIYLFVVLISFINFFFITMTILLVIAIIMDSKNNLRERQNNVVEDYTNKVIERMNIY